jgi:uncharacterized membrane protein
MEPGGSGQQGQPGSSRAGGAIIAVSVIVGAIAGTVAGEASAGVLIGLAAGVILALALWLKDRRG